MPTPPLLRRSLIGLAFVLIIGSLMFFGLAPMLVDDGDESGQHRTLS